MSIEGREGAATGIHSFLAKQLIEWQAGSAHAGGLNKTN